MTIRKSTPNRPSIAMTHATLRLWLLAVVPSALAQVPDGHPGSTECACIDPFTNHSMFADVSCALTRTSDGSNACFGVTYGSQGCRKYDDVPQGATASNTTECTPRLDHTPPPWCSAAWCWVDTSNCTRPKDTTSFFAGSAWSGLTFSYETCGNVNEFSDGGRTDFLNGLDLRVSFPGNSGSGYTITTVPVGVPGVAGTRRDGSVVRFWDQLARDYRMTWREVPVSDASKTFSPQSSFTACVHELSLNATDVCVGNFWPTADRQRLASFTVPIYSDEFKLVVAKTNATSAWGFADFSKQFEPFSPMTWLFIGLSTIYFGFVMWLVEAGHNQEDFPERSPLAGIAFGVFRAAYAFFTFDFRFSPTTNIGRLCLLVFAFSSLLLITYYAAQVTSSMVVKTSAAGEVASLQEAIDRGYTFCLLQAISSSVYLRYPNLDAISVRNADAVLAGLEDGTCQAGFVTVDEWRKRINDHCHRLVLLDSSVYSIANAYPVRDDLQAPMSWAITRALSAGAYEPLRRAAQSENLAAIDERCFDASETGATTQGQLNLTLTGGPMLLSAVMCSIALLWFWYTEARQAVYKKMSREERILETPSLADRTCNLNAAEKRKLAAAERESPAYEDQDLRLIARLVKSRNLTQIRVDAASNLRTDGPLTLNDVPMLLSVMRDAMFPQHEEGQYLRERAGSRDAGRGGTDLSKQQSGESAQSI